MAALHGDEHLQSIVDALISRHGVGAALETGTFKGDTTAWLAKRVKYVETVEAREDNHRHAINRLLSFANASVLLGNAADELPGMLRRAGVCTDQRILLFSDAHWQDYWPLKDELRACREWANANPGRLIVVVDDLRVPGHPNFQGCDGGGGSVGDPTYGPKTFAGGASADIDGFPELREWPQLWWPGYRAAEPVAGYAIVSDVELDLDGLPVWRDQC